MAGVESLTGAFGRLSVRAGRLSVIKVVLASK